MEHLGTLETVCRYPVKSMAGEEIKEAFVGYSGMMGDRVYAFVRPDGPQGFPWHTGREQKDLLLFHPHFHEAELSGRSRRRAVRFAREADRAGEGLCGRGMAGHERSSLCRTH